jgi:hypothetical protein
MAAQGKATLFRDGDLLAASYADEQQKRGSLVGVPLVWSVRLPYWLLLNAVTT